MYKFIYYFVNAVIVFFVGAITFFIISSEDKVIEAIFRDFNILLGIGLIFTLILLLFIYKLNRKTYEMKNSMNILSNNVIYSRTDFDGIIIDASEAFCKTYGYEREALVGKPYNILRHPDTSEEAYQNLWEDIKKGKEWKGEIKQLTKSGELVWTSTVITPELDDSGKVVGYLGISENISAKEKLKELSEVLELEIKKNKEKDSLMINNLIEYQLELSNSLIIAKEGQKSKDIFLANMSHEIRTPLNGIVGFLALLRETNINEAQLEYINMCQNSSKILLTIINDILDFSKMEAGKFELDKQPNNCKFELLNTAKLFTTQIEAKGLKYFITIDQNLPDCLVCDSSRSKQVLINLLGNAVKFTSGGEIHFDVKLLSKTDTTARIRYSVKDTGIGIPKEKQSLIFEAFSQADKFISGKFGGTGLGISIAKEIVSLAGGELLLESDTGKGAEFYYILTLDICNQIIKNDLNTQKSLNMLNKHKVLIAEDNKTNQMLIEILLKKRSIEVEIVENGKLAIDAYRKNPALYDLILMDIQMPIMNGIDATKEIIKYEIENHIPHTNIVALTANAIKGDKETYFEAGMDNYLPKPIDTNTLDKILSQYLIMKNDEPVVENSFKNVDKDADKVQYDVEKVAEEFGITTKMVLKLLKSFFSGYEGKSTLLLQACKDKEFETIRTICHTFKGSSGSVKLNMIFELTKEMEQNAREENSDFAYIDTCNKLQILIQEYKNILNNFLRAREK